jgi:multidrug efflux system outer membrane protein
MILAAGALAGCTLEPAYVRPTPAVPSTWPVGAAYPPASEVTLPALGYRDIFRDPHLQSIIGAALANNQDLQAALANVEIARAQYRVQRAQLLPKIDAAASAAESQTHTQAAGVTTQRRQVDRSFNADIGFSAFELDLFGRLRSLSHAAQQQYLASEAAERSARLTIVAEVADAYLTLAADRSLLVVAAETEVSAARSVDLTRARLTGGIAPRSDLSQAQTVLAQARSDRADLTTLVAQDRNALELLVGAPVADADLPASIETIDGMLSEAPAGLDSRILLRRPDVAQAERQLQAANAQIGAARAAFFPSISLTALAGVASPSLSALFNGNSFVWSAQAGAAQTLFDAGANRGNLDLAKARRDLAVAQYQQAIQTAFREVADALARRGTINGQMAAQTDLETAARDNYGLAEARYKEGIDPFLNVLVAQRTFYTARRTLAATRLVRADNLVTLYRSLGGDMLVDTTAGASAAGSNLR